MSEASDKGEELSAAEIASRGGKARAENLTPEERSEIARKFVGFPSRLRVDGPSRGFQEIGGRVWK